MKLLVVRYGRQLGKDDPDQAREFLAAAEKIAGLPGLLWKLLGLRRRGARRGEHLSLRDRRAGASLGRRPHEGGARQPCGHQRHRGPLLRRRRAPKRGHARTADSTRTRLTALARLAAANVACHGTGARADASVRRGRALRTRRRVVRIVRRGTSDSSGRGTRRCSPELPCSTTVAVSRKLRASPVRSSRHSASTAEANLSMSVADRAR